MRDLFQTSTRRLKGASRFGAVLLLTGCASAGGVRFARPAPEALPPASPLRSQSLHETDAWVRHFVMEAKYDSASIAISDSSNVAPKDRLQRMLQQGVLLHQAGRYAESNQVFELAEREADLRYTKSLTQAATLMLTNDGAMDYTPSKVEMSMIPYYRIKNYLALGQLDGAVVEARKANNYLAQLAGASADACTSNPLLQYLTGLVYSTAGETNDAVVSLRQAEKSFEACGPIFQTPAPAFFGHDLVRTAKAAGLEDVAGEAAKRYQIPVENGKSNGKKKASAPAPELGELVVLVEDGFVAHRAEQSIHIPILPQDIAGLDSGKPMEMLAAVGNITSQLIENLTEQGLWGAAYDDHPSVQLGKALDGAYIMKLTWPVYRLEANRAPAVRVKVGDQVVDAPAVQDVSAQVVRDFEAHKKVVLARAVGRGITKFLATQAMEKQAEKHGGALGGFVAGRLLNLAGNALESADQRSWSLLPDQVAVAHLELAPGEYPVQVEVLGADGGVADVRDLGTVKVEAGKHAFLSHRLWGTNAGDAERLARAVQGVEYLEPKAAAEEQDGEESGPAGHYTLREFYGSPLPAQAPQSAGAGQPCPGGGTVVSSAMTKGSINLRTDGIAEMRGTAAVTCATSGGGTRTMEVPQDMNGRYAVSGSTVRIQVGGGNTLNLSYDPAAGTLSWKEAGARWTR